MLSLPFRRPRRQYLTLGKVGKAFFSPLFRVPYPALRAHMHVIGRSGRGKSKALENIVCQHIANGEVLMGQPFSPLVAMPSVNCF